jgi:NAD(P)-dependent dehydrogenase (short-subunit alcohol dehydrogenase family)
MASSLIERFWKRCKRWRRLPLGQVALFYRLGRNVHVSPHPKRAKLVRRDRRELGAVVIAPKSRDAVVAEIPVRGEIAVVVGVGPGFGYALARKLAESGFRVVLASRNAQRLQPLAAELCAAGGDVRAVGCDATDEASIARLMTHVQSEIGTPNLVVYSVQGFVPGRALDVEAAAFEDCWRQNCLGGFLVARDVGRRMSVAGRGTIILTGSTSSLIARADHLTLAVGKFGLRALSQVLARELWPKGIHVAHLVIDADILEDAPPPDPQPHAEPEHIANLIVGLHRQHRSVWTSEVDIRPWNERFWEHC